MSNVAARLQATLEDLNDVDTSLDVRSYLIDRETRDEIPGAVHPLVCRHPDTSRPVLYLGRRENAYIVELPDDESDALLDEIWSYTTTADNSYSHQWQVGDVLMWDNRCTMHRRDDFDASARRIMHRSQVKGLRMAAAGA